MDSRGLVPDCTCGSLRILGAVWKTSGTKLNTLWWAPECTMCTFGDCKTPPRFGWWWIYAGLQLWATKETRGGTKQNPELERCKVARTKQRTNRLERWGVEGCKDRRFATAGRALMDTRGFKLLRAAESASLRGLQRWATKETRGGTNRLESLGVEGCEDQWRIATVGRGCPTTVGHSGLHTWAQAGVF